MNNNNKSCCKKSLFRRELWVVRMAFLFLTLGMWPANAAAAAPKATLLSINAKNKPVKEVFAEIEKKTEYIFFYSNDIVDVNRRVSVDVKNGTIETVLDQIFRSTDNSYEIKDRQIFIVKPEKSAAKKSESARQQPGTNRITGTVTDAKGNPLAGVNVIVKGTTIGVSSNIDGTYVIDVPLHASLVYSYIGYLNQEITPGAESICNIVLNEDNRVMEEVVVVGFGQQKKESVIGAIQSFKTSDMKMPAANLTNSFAGRIAGVISVQQSGEPGADGANFWIRGVSTFAEAAQNPLILIDGVECSSYDLNALAPEVIENFSILKDATATALYGSRGANGVMIVTTTGRQAEDQPARRGPHVDAHADSRTRRRRTVHADVQRGHRSAHARGRAEILGRGDPGNDQQAGPLRLPQRQLVQRAFQTAYLHAGGQPERLGRHRQASDLLHERVDHQRIGPAETGSGKPLQE